MKIDRDKELLQRVLELRDASHLMAAFHGEAEEEDQEQVEPATIHEMLRMLREKRRVRSYDQIKQYFDPVAEKIRSRRESQSEPKPKSPRIRKVRGAWRQVIKVLVKEKLLAKPISHQALKKSLAKKFPWIDWSQVCTASGFLDTSFS